MMKTLLRFISCLAISCLLTVVEAFHGISRISSSTRPHYSVASTATSTNQPTEEESSSSASSPSEKNTPSWKDRLIIHWKGEGIEGYSMQFRHWEFTGALEAVMTGDGSSSRKEVSLDFHDALQYTGKAAMLESKIMRFNQSMQYVDVSAMDIPLAQYIRAAQRSSLVHAVYLACADADNYEDLAEEASLNGSFDDMRLGQRNEAAKWCLRVRHFGANSNEKKERRYGGRTRSVSMEQEALKALTPKLLSTFGGGVDLEKPDCKIYIFDGMKDRRKVLARRLAVGPQTSIMAPATRMCVTNTPLCQLAAYSMCNIAGMRPHQTILDPYAGSCAILLAAALIDNSIKSVAIDIAHNGFVNRFDIRKDFISRNVMPPLDLLRGDCTDPAMRDLAREVTRGEPFDHIITDPPYGIRESTSFQQLTPIQELLRMISYDREKGTPLLKVGGKLVVFVPCSYEETLHDVMPSNEELEAAGLVPIGLREQPLNDKLSRWLVSFQCVR